MVYLIFFNVVVFFFLLLFFFFFFFDIVFFFQAEDGIRDLVRSRGLGDVYKRQVRGHGWFFLVKDRLALPVSVGLGGSVLRLLLTSVRTVQGLSLIHI